MDFIKMIMELPGEKRSQDVVESVEWNNLWRQIVIQGNHSENYLQELYDYLFDQVEGWVYKVQAELDGVQPYLEGVMTQPVGKAPDGSLWTYPSTESGTVPWGNVMGDITRQQDLMQEFDAKADVEHEHDISTLTFNEGDIDSSWIHYNSQDIPTNALKDLSVTSEKLGNGAVTSAKIASGAVINNSIANGSVSGVKIADSTITRAKLANDALYSPAIVRGTSNFVATDVGGTVQNNWSQAATYTLTQAFSTSLPLGATIAVLRSGSASSGFSVRIVGSGVRIAIYDDTYYKDSTVEIQGFMGMVALRKVAGDPTNGDLWVALGPVEVVS